MKKLTFCLTIFYFIILIAVPGYLIFNYYDILKTGESYKIEIGGFDPYDPFRGRYVAVRPLIDDLSRWGKHSYVLYKDENDFVVEAQIVDKTTKDRGFVKNFTLERYYMNEKLAPLAEDSLRNVLAEEGSTAYVVVKIKNGSYVIEGLFINDTAIEKY